MGKRYSFPFLCLRSSTHDPRGRTVFVHNKKERKIISMKVKELFSPKIGNAKLFPIMIRRNVS